jgi:hypothetical protein
MMNFWEPPNSAQSAGSKLVQPPGGAVIAGPDQMLEGYAGWNDAGHPMMGTIKNFGAWNLDEAPIPGLGGQGYFSSIETQLDASQICEGRNFLGMPGSARCSSERYLASGAFHDVGVDQIDSNQDPGSHGGYRVVPRIADDDDGGAQNGRTLSQRPSVVCGNSASTVEEKIANCHTLNPDNSEWDGRKRGTGAETLWVLVSVTSPHADGTMPDGQSCTSGSNCYEVWRDESTGAVWSDNLGVTNWCKASGSSGGGPFHEDDPYNICDSSTFQNQTTPESWCAEDQMLNTPTNYDMYKGNMVGVQSPVHWRLPTNSDWALAEVHGIRFVLPRMAGIYFWSATVSSSDRSTAHGFYGSDGSVSSGIPRNSTNGYSKFDSVRCIGVAAEPEVSVTNYQR